MLGNLGVIQVMNIDYIENMLYFGIGVLSRPDYLSTTGPECCHT